MPRTISNKGREQARCKLLEINLAGNNRRVRAV